MIEIDLTALIPESLRVDFDEDTLRGIMLDVVDAARAKWIRLAMDQLRSSQQEYVKGISGVRVEGDVAYITLDGALPNMIENGFSPFDMRDTLLGPGVPIVGPGEKGKQETEDGNFYRYIFFRIMGAGATGRNGQRTSDLYASELGEARAKKLGAIAEKAMKKLPATTSNPGEKTQWGGRLKTAGTDLDVLGTSHAMSKANDGFDVMGSSSGGVIAKEGETVLTRHGGAQHKAPLFEGAYRFEQKYKTKTQSFYGTFRTISTASPDGWIHPGYTPGAQLTDKVNEYALKLAGDLLAGLAKGG